MPVGVGFGETATLSKAANHAAKKLSGFNGVAVIDSKISRDEILNRMDVEEVWGIGSKIANRLKLEGIKNAAQLAKQNPKDIRTQFSVVTERTVSELNGISCLSWDEIQSPKKEIFSTRSFGQRITTKGQLRAALVTHASIVGKKVRRQPSLIKKLMVFASNSPHDALYYKQSIVYPFIMPTDNTCEMAQATNNVIDSTFREGIGFYRLVPNRAEGKSALATRDTDLANYYLDWSNLNSITIEEVEALFSSFWQRYRAVDKVNAALVTLGLD